MPRNPVVRWCSRASTSCARRPPATDTSESGSRSNAIASAYAVCVFSPTRPVLETNSRLNASRIDRKRARYAAASSLRPSAAALRDTRSVECARNAVAIRSVPVVAPG